jgi:hypothetical protein
MQTSTWSWYRPSLARKSVVLYASRAAAIDATVTSSTTTWGASNTSPVTGWRAPACNRAIEAPSLCPISTG